MVSETEALFVANRISMGLWIASVFRWPVRLTDEVPCWRLVAMMGELSCGTFSRAASRKSSMPMFIQCVPSGKFQFGIFVQWHITLETNAVTTWSACIKTIMHTQREERHSVSAVGTEMDASCWAQQQTMWCQSGMFYLEIVKRRTDFHRRYSKFSSTQEIGNVSPCILLTFGLLSMNFSLTSASQHVQLEMTDFLFVHFAENSSWFVRWNTQLSWWLWRETTQLFPWMMT